MTEFRLPLFLMIYLSNDVKMITFVFQLNNQKEAIESCRFQQTSCGVFENLCRMADLFQFFVLYIRIISVTSK